MKIPNSDPWNIFSLISVATEQGAGHGENSCKKFFTGNIHTRECYYDVVNFWSKSNLSIRFV